jgi:hypothetical protein
MRGVAVCCGFNSYRGRPLSTAVNDAAILYTRLTESGNFDAAPDGMKSELFSQPTSANAVLAAFTRAALSSAELVWFSFSGHAIVTRAGELRLLLPDWQPDASEIDQRTYSIGADEIGNVLQSRLGNKKFVVVLDTCYSGAFGPIGATRDVGPAVQKQIVSAGAVVISSCAGDQLAGDGHPELGERNGAFTAAVIEVLDAHAATRTPLSVLQLFQETKDRVRNGQLPTLYVNGLTEDFVIAGNPVRPDPPDGIATLSAEVPVMLKDEISAFLNSVVHLRRRRRVGLIHAQRQLERLAAEFYCYGDDAFVVPGDNSNVIEAFDTARRCIVGCTTPAYVEEWRRHGSGLLAANRELISRRGRVVRFFFVRDDSESRDRAVLDLIRDHVEAGILAVVVNVNSFGRAVLQEVFKDRRPDDLNTLECAFVDGKIFLRTHFAVNGELRIELDQRPTRCHNEYKTQLRPFLTSDGLLLGASLCRDRDEGVELSPLQIDDIGELRQQLESDLGVAA